MRAGRERRGLRGALPPEAADGVRPACRVAAAAVHFLGFQSDFWTSSPAVLNVNARCFGV